jgi:hypothetical protein
MSARSYNTEDLEPYLRRVERGEATLVDINKETGVATGTLLKHMRKLGISRNLKPKSPMRDLPKPSVLSALKSRLMPPPVMQKREVEQGVRIIVIPDMQVKPGIPLDYCSYIGKYCADKKPNIIVCGGDFADMPSLSMHDAPGSKKMEGARYEDDIFAVRTAMKLMMTPIREEMERSGWEPRLVMLLGNHEDRIRRAIENAPKLEGTIGMCDLGYEDEGFEVHDFLEPVNILNIIFSHYFVSGVMGRPITTARALLNKLHMSCFAFHQQGRDIAFGKRADGRQIISILSGSCYEHDEDYLNPQSNNHWRGLYVLNDVRDGEFEENAVSLRYLRRKYG